MKRARPEAPDPDLREEVRLLGGLLGDTLRGSGGEALFELVEDVRALAKGARRGREQDAQALGRRLVALGADRALPLARAFSHFLRLANLAEQRHRGRAERLHAEGSLGDVLARLAQGGAERLVEAVARLRVELVLTAHPTQVVRRTLLQKYRRIAQALERRRRAGLSPHEKGRIVAELRSEIAALWHTDEVRRERPTPVDEARAGLVLFEQVVWDALPAFLRELDAALSENAGRGLPLDAAPVRFGSWMGGDRDGNPNVTPAVTAEACLLARWMAADLYRKELERLHDELSVAPCTAELRARVGDAREPYRTLLKRLLDRLAATRAWCEAALEAQQAGRPAPERSGAPLLLDAEELRRELLLCHASLSASGLGILADGRLLDVLRRLAAFGVTLAPLDVRQDAAVHEAALAALTRAAGLGSYADWSEEQRLEYLVRELASRGPRSSRAPSEAADDEALRDVLDTLSVCARQGPGSLGAYVVSMASQASDVLAVYLLQREAGLAPPLRVVPLFETLDDLQRAPAVAARLLEIPWYREQVLGGAEVMVGYSDSAKDAGRLAAAWALYRAQEELSELYRSRGVPLTLFHGRGGTIARGGGPIYLAVLSQPPGSVDGRLRVTIQGETIDSTFGLPEVARQSLARYALAALEATLAPPRAPIPEWRALMDRLAENGASAYRATLRSGPAFLRYFHASTPQDELSLLNVGSRPARRRSGGGLESLRAIPWIFAWTQTRLLLPSWLGVGEALGAAWQEGHGRTIRAMARDWPFFRSLVDLLEMVLAKADPEIAARYDAVLVPEELRPLGGELRLRLRETQAWVLRAKGARVLLAGDPFLRRSIALRNPYVDPLNLLQVELLRRVRRGEDGGLRDALLVTINGIAAGMRNTG